MNIYEYGGDAIDLEKAAAELKATSLIQGENTRRERLAEITAAALLDVAGSLRVLANEAAAAMLPAASVEYFATAEPFTPGDESDGPRDFLLEGDLVHKIDDDEPGEVVSLGFDGDGALFADVEFGAGPVRLYASSLVRLVGDEARDLEALEAVEALIEVRVDVVNEISDAEEAADPDLVDLDAEPINHFFVDALGDPETCTDPTHRHPEPGDEPAGTIAPADLVDDIDADFGDESHPAAESAVDVLRANEAARKAAKKKGGKK